jgi:translation elongation factor EF-G
LTGEVHPLLAGASLKNRGIRRLLDAIVDFLPSPLEVRAVEGVKPGTDEIVRRNPNPQLPLAALVYKVMNDETHNRLHYVRVYSGTLEKGEKLWNPRPRHRGACGAHLSHALQQESGDRQRVGGRHRRARRNEEDLNRRHALPPRARDLARADRIPNPVISAAIEPKNQAELESLERALDELTVEDPTFIVHEDPDTGQRIISGMGELHLEVLVDRIRREHRLEARVGQPQVSYRETISKESEAEGRFEREIAEKMHRATVRLRLTPGEKNSGFQFTSKIEPPRISPPALRWIEESARNAMGSGPFAGYTLIDIGVSLTGRGIAAGNGDRDRGARRHRGCVPQRRLQGRRAALGAGREIGSSRSQRIRGRSASRFECAACPGHGSGVARHERASDGNRGTLPHVRLRDRPALVDPRAGHLHDGAFPTSSPRWKRCRNSSRSSVSEFRAGTPISSAFVRVW